MYADGRGVDKDEKHAVELHTLAADQGHVEAQFNLGNMYRDGQGVDKDDNRAESMETVARVSWWNTWQRNSDNSTKTANAMLVNEMGILYPPGRGIVNGLLSSTDCTQE